MTENQKVKMSRTGYTKSTTLATSALIGCTLEKDVKDRFINRTFTFNPFSSSPGLVGGATALASRDASYLLSIAFLHTSHNFHDPSAIIPKASIFNQRSRRRRRMMKKVIW